MALAEAHGLDPHPVEISLAEHAAPAEHDAKLIANVIVGQEGSLRVHPLKVSYPGNQQPAYQSRPKGEGVNFASNFNPRAAFWRIWE